MIGLSPPQGWKEHRLGDIVQIERESILPGAISSGTSYLGLEHLGSDGSIVSVQSVENGDLASNKFRFTSSHVLYGKLRPYLSKIVRPGFEGVCSTDILPVRPGRSVNKDYLFYYLRHPRMVDYASARSEGANLPRLSPTQLERFPIFLPPTFEEQQRIAAILDRAAAIRRKRQQIHDSLPNVSESLFEHLFGDPVLNPRRLATVALGEVLSLQGGFAFKSTDYCDSGIPLIRIGNANNLDFDISSLVYLPPHFLESYSRFVLSPGDMIMTLTGTVGKDDYANLVKVPAFFDRWFLNQRVARVRITDQRIDENYLVSFLMHPRIKRLIRKMDRGVRQANLSNEDILKQMIPLPTQENQRRFSEVVTQTVKLQSTLATSMIEDEFLYSSLIQRAFRGELTT
jgi:type I restriction enzyme S subunit